MKQLHMISVLLALVLVGCRPITQQPAQQKAQQPADTSGSEQAVPLTPQAAQPEADKIANAMSGGLRSLARDATILDWPAKAGADPVKLREGTNDWVCRPDDPTTPTNDPRCLDSHWRELIDTPFDAARNAHKAFGIAYMLQGGTVADNFDPNALEPTAGQDWVMDGPHVMLVFVNEETSDAFSTDHHKGGPYVMFEGVPWEHLMVPAVAEAAPADEPIFNAMSAAPLKIAENAAIMDWPKEAGGDLVELRAGDNGWTCLTDNPTSPANDPMCGDKQWMEYLNAIMAGRAPKYTGVGIGYMLQGGSVASSTDPSLRKPPAGQDWMVDGPHFTVIVPWDLDPALYSTDPKSGGPYIRFEGTPYEHLIVPVADATK